MSGLGPVWAIIIAAVLMLIGVALGYRVRSRDTHRDAPATPSPAIASSSEPMTVRVGNSQRVDRLHRALTLSVGENADLLELTFDRIPKLRIGVVSIEGECARIKVELGGAVAGCGSLVKEVGTNEFLVPCAQQEEQRASILHFQGQDDEVSFLRIKVVKIDSNEQCVDLDVLHVCGNWREQALH